MVLVIHIVLYSLKKIKKYLYKHDEKHPKRGISVKILKSNLLCTFGTETFSSQIEFTHFFFFFFQSEMKRKTDLLVRDNFVRIVFPTVKQKREITEITFPQNLRYSYNIYHHSQNDDLRINHDL